MCFKIGYLIHMYILKHAFFPLNMCWTSFHRSVCIFINSCRLFYNMIVSYFKYLLANVVFFFHFFTITNAL